MKKLVLIMLMSLFTSNITIYCQNISETKLNNTKKVFLQFDNDYGMLCNKISSTIGAGLGYKFNDYISAGISANGIWYDYRLNELDPNMSYHVESGYATVFIQGIYPVSETIEISAALFSGQGTIQLKYDRKYQDQLKWDEEIIDKTTYSIAELRFGAGYKLNQNLKIGLTASYRATSEIFIETVDKDFLNTLKYGFSIQYSIF